LGCNGGDEIRPDFLRSLSHEAEYVRGPRLQPAR
jgi:hypothetical protein